MISQLTHKFQSVETCPTFITKLVLVIFFLFLPIIADSRDRDFDPDLLPPLPAPELILPQTERRIHAGESTEFIWKEVEGADHYTLLVIRTTHPAKKWNFRKQKWPRKTLKLVPGHYRWKVIAYTKDETRHRPSENGEFTLVFKDSNSSDNSDSNSPVSNPLLTGSSAEKLYPPYLTEEEKEEEKEKLRPKEHKDSEFSAFSPEWLNLSASFDMLLRTMDDSAMGLTYSMTPHLLHRASPVNLIPEARISYFTKMDGDGFFMLKGGGELQLKIYNKTYIAVSSGIGRSYRDTNSQSFHYFGLIAGRRYFKGEAGKLLDRTYVRFEFNSTKPRFRHIALGMGFNF
jgi:hypothetical protein